MSETKWIINHTGHNSPLYQLSVRPLPLSVVVPPSLVAFVVGKTFTPPLSCTEYVCACKPLCSVPAVHIHAHASSVSLQPDVQSPRLGCNAVTVIINLHQYFNTTESDSWFCHKLSASGVIQGYMDNCRGFFSSLLSNSICPEIVEWLSQPPLEPYAILLA